MHKITLTAPDDWHLHVRDGALMRSIVACSARQFDRALIMPNLLPPITVVPQALAYAKRIRQAVPHGLAFEPLISLYLTDRTSIQEVERAAATQGILGFKLYPAGATTNSDSGVTDIEKITAVLEAMAESRLVLQVHGEVTDANVDVFDREAVFINRILEPLRLRIPQLRIVLEHVTTKEGIEFVHAHDNIAATITAHHLMINRNQLFAGGLRPHHYCLPVLKRESHRQVLVEAAISGDPAFFLGTDSAPHRKRDKETGCGCAGIFTAESAMALYATLFEQCNALDKLENFSSRYGADFYGLNPNSSSITLIRDPSQIPDLIDAGDDVIVPFMAGETINWRTVVPTDHQQS